MTTDHPPARKDVRERFVEALDTMLSDYGHVIGRYGRDPVSNLKQSRAEVLRLYDAASQPAAGVEVAWDRCDACNGTLGDHYAPDGGGCPGFRKHVPLKAGGVKS